MGNDQTVPGFHFLRNRILLFSILITLVPSLGMGWFWFDLTRKATTEKIEQKFIDAAGIAEREISLWLKERNYDLRVFASSSIILDNLQPSVGVTGESGQQIEDGKRSRQRKITTYLNLIKAQFPAYRRLAVLTGDGDILASSGSSGDDRPLSLPADWRTQNENSHFFTGKAVRIGKESLPVMPIGIALYAAGKGLPLGFLVMEVELTGLLPVLRSLLPRTDGANLGSITLFAGDGLVILAAGANVSPAVPAISQEQSGKLLETPGQLQDFAGDGSTRQIGMVHSFENPPWHLLIAEDSNEVFAGLIAARNRIILITILLTVAIGGTATIIARRIIVPLERLTEGVLRVAGGDLDVAVPVRGEDEFGLVSGMFNEMVRRLKENQAKLEQMATTDSLTGLANRKQIMADLTVHFENFRRHGTDFSLLMIDIDHFKRINDSHGHLVGDAVLVQLAGLLQDTLRILDSAGRYGGEEFLVILGQADLNQATITAERIRVAVDRQVFTCGEVALRVTVSIGAAAVQAEDSSTGLIGRADAALYEAKAAGRNRVVPAG
jgi:diguanylate cyclase (GGDEF)-like protein